MAEEHRCQPPQLCVNNCGFFGSPTTQNLCSKCYRDLQLKEQQALALNQTLISSSSSPSSSCPLSSPLVSVSPSHVEAKEEEKEAAPSAGAHANKCKTCRRRVGLTGFQCRCGMTFCGIHRYPEQHACGFDFRGMGKEQIAKANPVEFGAVVHSKSVVCEHVCIGSGAVVGPSVTVGQSTKIGYNVALSNCSIGDSCIIHSGVCIGQDGFGFMVDEHGNMLKRPQMLNARIGNQVEIGANTCIDRGSWRDTVVGDHSKIDNLVQIGHNVVIGNNCIVCGQVGIAGSVTIGDYVTMGGRVAVRDHVSIISKVRLAGMSCVMKDITEPGDYGGFPAVPAHEWRRQVTNYSRTSKQWNPENH